MSAAKLSRDWRSVARRRSVSLRPHGRRRCTSCEPSSGGRFSTRPNRKRRRRITCTIHTKLFLLVASIHLLSVHPMIYLEDPEGAIRYDHLPDGSDVWVHEYVDGAMNVAEVPFKLGTPEHYLTWPPGTSAPATDPMSMSVGLGGEGGEEVSNPPSASPTPVGSMDTLANSTADPIIGEEESISNSTTNPTQNTTSGSSLFGRRLDTTLESASRDETPTPTFFPSVDTDSVIPEITGEFTDNFQPYDHPPIHGESSGNDLLDFFDDLQLIKDERKFVYYDSKQARFGVDLGPLGNAEFVNLILPPRWYGDWEVDEEMAEAKELPELPELEGGFDTSNITGLDVGADDTVNGTANVTGDSELGAETVNQTTAPHQEVNRTRGRGLTTWDQLWEDFVSGSYSPPNDEGNATTTETTAHGGIFDETFQPDSSNMTASGTADSDSDADTAVDDGTQNSTGATAGTANITIGVQNITSNDGATKPGQEYQERPPIPPQTQSRIAIADYFCFEDFVNWMIERRNASTTRNAHVDLAASVQNATMAGTPDNTTATAPNQANADNHSDQAKEAKMVESTRPLTILASRGRCSFESKARLAMLLNDLFANSGRTNRIDHLIIYNNGTDTDNNTMNEEKLIDMSRVTQVVDSGRPGPENAVVGDRIKVGLLYVATKSGADILRRIEVREGETNVSPYMDVSMLFPDDDTDDDSDTRKRQLRGRERALFEGLEQDGLIKDHENHATIGQDADDNGFYDAQIAHGWFFPATLTRFCHSCGPELQWGMVWGGGSSTTNDKPGSKPAHPGDPSDPDGRGPPSTPIDLGGRYPTTVDYYSKPWLEVVRKLMIAILIILLIGPLLLAARRWYTVGGTFRITTDENGNRRVRMVSPNLEVFVNGVPGTVETNGTKLDRSQVFSLPEVEYTGEGSVVDEENIGEHDGVMEDAESGDETSDGHESSDDAEPSGSEPLMAASIPISPSRDTVTSGRFVSSSTCSICIDEFVPGEMLRVLPRCNHAFHTECILPWLTERQGCCPMCKVPVLPDEMQRSRRRRSRRRRGRRRMFGSGGGQRRHQPRSTPNVAQDQESTTSAAAHNAPSTESSPNIVEGVRLISEIEGDLDPAPRVVTPDGSPRSASDALVNFGMDASDDERAGAATDDATDLGVLEQGRPVTPGPDDDIGYVGLVTDDAEAAHSPHGDEVPLPADDSNSSSDHAFAPAGDSER